MAFNHRLRFRHRTRAGAALLAMLLAGAHAHAQDGAAPDAAAEAIKRAEAELTRRIQEENDKGGVKRGYVTPSTRDAAYAIYYKKLAERIGRIDRTMKRAHPEMARGSTLSGTLKAIVTVSILANGAVEKVVIEQSSGDPAVDRKIGELVGLGAPFDAFTPSMRSKYGVLDLTMTWTFERVGTKVQGSD